MSMSEPRVETRTGLHDAIGPANSVKPKIRWKKQFLWIGLIILLFILPSIIKDTYLVFLMNHIGIYILLVLGMNLLIGFTGQFNFGLAGFYAIGAYTSALLTLRAGLSFWIALPAAGIVAAFFGVIIGPVLKLRGHILVMATIAFAEIVRLVSLNWVSLTRGPAGLPGIPYPRIGPFDLSNEHRFYYLTVTCVIVAYLVIARMINSRVGRALRAIRNDELAAWISGINIVHYKILALAVASFFMGIAGSLYAHLNSFISPHIFTLEETVKVLTMVVVGGSGSIAGSVIGAMVLVFSSEYLRFLQQYRLIVYAGLMLAVLLFAPKGLYGILKWLIDALKAKVSSKINGRTT